MIAAQELRIGSKVFYQFSQEQPPQIVTIAWVGEDSAGYKEQHEASYPQSLSKFSGIPLTPEILEGLGYGSGELLEVMGKIVVEKDRTPNSAVIIYEKHFRRKLQYLHHIQNLQFDLTGQELEINL